MWNSDETMRWCQLSVLVDSTRVSVVDIDCAKMNEAQKRLFSVAFGITSSVLDNSRKTQRLLEEEDDELLLIVSQFTMM